MRRPPAPRLQAGRPGAQPVPAARERLASEHAQASAQAPQVSPAPQTAQATQASQTSAPSRTPAELAVPGAPSRRALLLAGTVATAIALPVVAGGLLARRGHDSPPAASSGGGGTTVDAETSSPFSDVADGAAGLTAMLWAEECGVQPARANGTYGPDVPVARKDLALALHRFAGSPDVALEAAPLLIADIGSDPLHARALLWLHGRGALWGDQELRVHPEDEATRECAAQMVTALVRPALAGVGVSWDPASDSVLAGTAEAEPPAEEVAWLAAAGMLISAQEPDGPTEWDGEQTVTRAHLAVILRRVDEVIASELT